MVNDKKYGGITIFIGSVLLICIALIAYYIAFIPKLIENEQVYKDFSGNIVFIKIINKYIAFFKPIFGDTPSTPMLSIFIPLAIIILIAFSIYLNKFLVQKKLENIKSNEEVVYNDQSAIQG
ncbi:MAG: hypothetical protein A2Y15_03015 [Clostridiales bacterium GWF2_36_10]|nr:MAG: hypothetical protein A2Y15_03015 [Clostridiales bacterium GWF2_36_10]HAN20944.1 hypothetical protein [Clostridiales bacterium]